MQNLLTDSDNVISDIINRVLNCSRNNSLYVWRNNTTNLDGIYNTISIIPYNSSSEISDKIAYAYVSKSDQHLFFAEIKNYFDINLIVYSEDKLTGVRDTCRLVNLNIFQHLSGYLYLFGPLFCPKKINTPSDFSVLAIVHFYNEEDVIEKTITHLLEQEVDVYLLDNWSKDNSYQIALKYQKLFPDRIMLERFPKTGKSDTYQWYDQLGYTEKIAKELKYNWFIHYDMDEIRISPWNDVTIRDALYWIDKQGYSCVENTVIDFRVTEIDEENIFGKDTYFDFRHDKLDFDQVKTWKKSDYVDIRGSLGHFIHIDYPKMYPLKFLNKHYPLRTVEHSMRKVFKDRLPRFVKERALHGGHGHYDHFVGAKAEEFIYDKNKLMLWNDKTFDEYYLPLFTECGINWNLSEDDSLYISNYDISNKKIIIYGAGVWGRKLICKLEKSNTIIALLDSKPENNPSFHCLIPVLPSELIFEKQFDYIVIAIKNVCAQTEIMKMLKDKYGIQESSIICCK